MAQAWLGTSGAPSTAEPLTRAGHFLRADLSHADAAPPPAAGQRFAPGDTVLNVNPGPVNLRQSPGFQNKPASDVITAIPAGQAGVIAGGPVEADGLVWWQVRFGERTGWMAERSSSGVTLLDRTP